MQARSRSILMTAAILAAAATSPAAGPPGFIFPDDNPVAAPRPVEQMPGGPAAPAAPTSAKSGPATKQGTSDWVARGPFGISGGQVEGMDSFPNQVAGAVHVVLPHPTDPNVIWAGSVNGGIWRTENAAIANDITWTFTTGNLTSQSIGALELDHSSYDPFRLASNPGQPLTLVAGVGRFSSLAQLGGELVGVYRSTDSGRTWRNPGSRGLAGVSISGLAARGDRIIVAGSKLTGEVGGVFLSINGGGDFVSLTSDGTSGLPIGEGAYDLVGVPHNFALGNTAFPNLLYVAMESGVYRSNNGGGFWVPISGQNFDQAEPVIIRAGDGATNNIEIAVHNGGSENVVVYVGVVNEGQLVGLFRGVDPDPNGEFDDPSSIDFTWTALDVPVTNENGTVVGIQPRPKPGAQGFIHFSIGADPLNDQIVYVGGDRQPLSDGPNEGSFPNSIGANNFTGRLFRVDASLAAGSQAVSLTHLQGVSTISNSAPHADSREIAFNLNGDMIQSDDGGVYLRSNPRGIGDWIPLNRDLRVTEIHSADWNSVTDTITGGTQDVGTVRMPNATARTWATVNQGDGGVVQIDDWSERSQGVTYEYTSAQFLGGFRRTRFTNNTVAATEFPALIVNGENLPLSFVDDTIQFYTPFVLNAIDGRRGAIGTRSIYTTNDRFDTLTRLDVPQVENAGVVTSIAFGGRANGADAPGVLYATYSRGQFVRRLPTGSGVETSILPTSGRPTDLTIDPRNYRRVFITVDSPAAVLASSDAGTTWLDVTGNLGPLLANDRNQLNTITFVPAPGGVGDGAIVVGGMRGVFYANSVTPAWDRVGSTLPRLYVSDLRYDRFDDLLLVGTLGGGAWTFGNASTELAGEGAISITPAAIDVTLVRGSVADIRLPILSNIGVFPITWSSTLEYLDPLPPPFWVTLEDEFSGGFFGPGETTEIPLSFDVADLPVGVYTAQLTFTGFYDDPRTGDIVLLDPLIMPIRIQMLPVPARIALSVTELRNTILQGQSVSEQSFSVINTGEVTLEYYLFERANWFDLFAADGRQVFEFDRLDLAPGGTATFTVRYNTSFLSPGAYREGIILSSPNASNSPQVIDARLVVSPQAAWMLY